MANSVILVLELILVSVIVLKLQL